MRMFINMNWSKIMRKKSFIIICIISLVFGNMLVGCNKNKDTDEDILVNTQQKQGIVLPDDEW